MLLARYRRDPADRWIDPSAAHGLTHQPASIIQPPFQYQYEPQLLALPASVQMLNGHGLAKDSAGNIYFTFQPVSVETQTRVLVRFNPDGTGGTLLGDDNRLAYGVPHGLRIRTEADGMQ